MSKDPTRKCQGCPSRLDGIFCDLSNDLLSDLSSHKVTNKYKKGQTLFVEGNPTYGLYCISTGNIKISKMSKDGKERIVRLATGGDVLGHRSLFTEKYYSATATALEDTKVCFIDKIYILKLVQSEPSVASRLITKLGENLGVSENKIASYSQRNVFERVAELLLTLNASHGEVVENGSRINLILTREEMASYLGTATETLIRCLSEIKENNVITQSGKKIIILDEEKLIEYANIQY